ncbi:MAG: ABC transporter ATP-binding protein [Pseudomonadota bacterium]
MSAGLAVERVTKRYGSAAALDAVSLEVAEGAYAVVLGPSGSGKSTLLGLLGGFIDPDEGRVRIGGEDVTALGPVKRPTTTVFQDYALFPHMDLADNVAFGLRMRGWKKRERRARAAEVLALVGLEGAAGRRPHALSGGQRQRVALARALAVEPAVLLLDEPLGALDLALRRAMQRELKAIQRRLGTTFVHVTHDQEEAMAIADMVVVMNEGRIADAGPPERVYLRPASRFAARFMGEINLLPVRALPRRHGRVMLETPLGPLPAPTGTLPEGRAALGIRPEHLGLAEEDAPPSGRVQIPAEVRETSFFGTHHRVVVAPQPAGPTLIAHLPQRADPSPGSRLTLSLDPDDAVILPAGDDAEDRE